MPRRPRGARLGAPSINEVKGSIFDTGLEETIELPSTLAVNVRDYVVSTFENNPYLGKAQLNPVIRYAKLLVVFDSIASLVDTQGLEVMDRFGDGKPNPHSLTMLKLQSSLASAEQALAIAIPTRREQITKAEEKPPARGVGRPRKTDARAGLRLA